MSSERKLTEADLPRIHAVLHKLAMKLKRAGAKAAHGYIDPDTMIESLRHRKHAYIVDGYLVVYELGTPWYATDDVLFIAEQLVLRIAVSGDFAAIPAFLERKGREAGCQMAIAGTALARSDKALASLYNSSGFTTEGYSLTKVL